MDYLSYNILIYFKLLLSLIQFLFFLYLFIQNIKVTQENKKVIKKTKNKNLKI